MQIKGIKSDRTMLNLVIRTKGITRNAIRKGFYRSGIDIIGRKGSTNDGLVKQQMNSAKTGRLYKVYTSKSGGILKKVRLHRASAVGQSPAVLTGALRKSLDFTVLGSSQLRISADTPYARILELGGNAGRNGASRIGRRNYLRKAILQSRRNIINNIQSEMK